MTGVRMLVAATLLAMSPLPASPRQDAPVPILATFTVGERAEYNVKFGFVRVGVASIETAAVDTVRNRPAYRFVLHIDGSVNMLLYKYRLRDSLISWVDTARFESMRFEQHQEESGRRRDRYYEIFGDRARYQQRDNPETLSVANPLDELAFLQFVRTIELEVGKTLEFARYFKAESNPVKLIVLRREEVEVPAGKFRTVVVQPIIKTRGMFSEGGQAQVWFSDDSLRRIVKVSTKLSVGSIHLEMRSHRAGAAEADQR